MSTLPPISANQHTQGEIASLIVHLKKTRAKARGTIILSALLTSASIIILTITALAMADYLLHLPVGIRILSLGLTLFLALRCWNNRIKPAIDVNISESDIALHIEHQDPAFRGLLANASDLSRQINNPASDSITIALASAALKSISRRLADRTASGSLPTALNLRDLSRSALTIALIIIALAVFNTRSPDLFSIGARRMLTPWSSTNWPMKFEIHDTTDPSPRPTDLAVPISAAIGSRSTADTSARASVLWRIFENEPGTQRPSNPVTQWTRTLLVSQRTKSESGSAIYEQILDPQSVISNSTSTSFTLEYTIESRDDSSSARRITLVRPPKLIGTTINISPPRYASAITESGLIRSEKTTTAQYDSIVSPILAESSLIITWQFSKPVSVAENQGARWITAIQPANTILRFDQPTPNTIAIELVAHNSSAIQPAVLDELGIPVRTPIVLNLGVLTDHPPATAVSDPPRDELVSAHAIIHIQASLSDDFGLHTGSIHATRAIRAQNSSSGTHEPTDEGSLLVEQTLGASLDAQLSVDLDLRTLQLVAGDQIWINSRALDLRAAAEDSLLGHTESSPRILRIVDDQDLIDLIQGALGSIRTSLRQLDEQQADLQSTLSQGTTDQMAARISNDQQALSDRLAIHSRTVDQLKKNIIRNTLDDPSLASLLDDANIMLSEAIEASERASMQIDRDQMNKAETNQSKVRDRIGELLTMLDRGQDSWLAMRSIERLRNELETLRNDTAELNEQTAGRAKSQLSEQQQSRLEQILKRQLALADDAQNAMSTLDEHAKKLDENDPAQARALREAAEKGRSAQIQQRLEQAADQIESNQTSSATQTQTEVLEELDSMLEDLESTINDRDNALRRELASIIDSLKALISSQESQIEQVDSPNATPQLVALFGNTLAVRDDALGAFPETRSIADLITKASKAQSNAINALRQSLSATEKALRFERTSLLNLNSALEEAQRLDEQAADRQAKQLRSQLRDAYRQALDTQTILRDETSLLVGDPLNRRQRSNARALATTQSDVRDQLAELLEETQELADAPMFTLAHAQLDRQMEQIARKLTERSINQQIISKHDFSITILATLVEVLSDEQQADTQEDFDDGSSGGESGGSGSEGDEPVIPPVAQLKLLRSMQQLVALQTHKISESITPASSSQIEAVSQLQRQLFEHGQKLIEDMSQQPQPSPHTDEHLEIKPEEGNESE